MSLGKEKKGGIKKFASSVGKLHFKNSRMPVLFTSLCFVFLVKTCKPMTFSLLQAASYDCPKADGMTKVKVAYLVTALADSATSSLAANPIPV